MKANGKLAVDTNAAIAYREGIPAVCTLIESAETFFLPVIVLGELLYGAINSSKPEKNVQAINKFSASSVLMPVDEAVATRYAKIRSDLKMKGHPIPENDIWIASICLELSVPILSNDSHFDYIENLEVINWEND